MTFQPADPTDEERDVFLGALACESPEQRRAFLERACANQPAMRRTVEALLQHHQDDDFMQPRGLKSEPLAVLEKPGSRIGRYKLLEQIGEGGCGVVYMAEQEEPVRRQVALKLVKLGMDTKSVIARFEAERQALALMDHPNIAKVLDAGATDTGRPYFVMELVRGTKITDYCDQNNLPPRERLQLFIRVCQALQHAHQKGVIHRDIKPSNILVTLRDGTPVPKVIDFGIAKATTDQRLTDKTLFTAFQQFLGTPAYMSPEQAEMSELGVDTRSDIYSLGVLLYELLTGQTPFDAKTLARSGLDETRRLIREQEPVRPSTRLSTMHDAELKDVALSRRTEAAKLIHLVRGDLDWVVMKALEKDRARRYETANGLAMDIQRHLQNEPVVARPPSNLYKFQKLVRRNKLAFLAAGAVNAALILALAVALVAVVRIRHANRQIQQAERDAVEKLRAAYLAEARATRTSGHPGQRFDSLEKVRKAVAIGADLEARNEVIACLAVPDLRVARQIPIQGHTHNEHACFDLNLDRYAFGATNGDLVIRAARNHQVVCVLPAPGYASAGGLGFSADGNYLKAQYSRDQEGDSSWVWDVPAQKVVVRVLNQADDTNAIPFAFAGDFSPDSRLFASSSRAGGVSIWELGSGRELQRFQAARPFSRLTFGPGNVWLACSSREDPGVEIREVASGRKLLTLNCPAGVSAVGWSPDGGRLVTACMDNTIYVWNAATGRRTAVFEGDTSFITSLAFNHAGSLVASAGYDNLVQLWSPDSGRKLVNYPGSSWQLQFSPDDRYLRGWQNGYRYGSLEVVVSPECRQLCVPREGGFTCLPAFSADGRVLAVATETKVRFWDTVSGQGIAGIACKHSDDVIFNPDGRSLIQVDRDEGVRQRTWERAGGAAAPAYRLGPPRALFNAQFMQGAAVSADGRYLGTTRQMEGEALIFDLQNPGAELVLAGQPMVNRIALSPDGRWAATASWHNSLLKVWDARSGDLVRTASLPDRASVTFSPDGGWLAISSASFQVWRVGSWQPKGPPEPGVDEPVENHTAFSPDSRIMARTQGHKIQLLATETGKTLAMLEPPGSSLVGRLQFSPDGTQLAAVQFDQQVQLWNLRLIREELAGLHEDWDLPPYPPTPPTLADGPATLEIASEADSQGPKPGEVRSAVR